MSRDPNDPWARGAWSPVPPPYDPSLDGPYLDSQEEPPMNLDEFEVEHDYTEPSADERSKGSSVSPKEQTRKPSQSAQLVEMARSLYRIIKCTDGKTYAVKKNEPGIAMEIRSRKASFRPQLKGLYYETTKQTATDTAFSEMLDVLESDALKTEELPVFLRFGTFGTSTVVVDLGQPAGGAIVVSSTGVEVVEHSPVLFRRTALISPMPAPDLSGRLDDFRDIFNVSEQGFRLLVGWLIAACIPDMPRPILLLLGQQGTAKTTALKMLIMLISDSPTPVSSTPSTPEDWAITANSNPVIGLDNVSRLTPWFQDALCKAVTGDGYITREKYSDSDVTVLSFQRVMGMTSIDPGTLQGDVIDRMIQVELEPIPKSGRKTDREVTVRFESVRRSAHGAILNLLSKVLGKLPSVSLTESPRMADFALLLKALDDVTGWSTLDDYLRTIDSASADAVDGDLFATAVLDLAEKRSTWTGTASELLKEITPDSPPKGWPTAPHTVSGRLKRSVDNLKSKGVQVVYSRAAGGSRLITISSGAINLCTICDSPLSPKTPNLTEHPGCSMPGSEPFFS